MIGRVRCSGTASCAKLPTSTSSLGVTEKMESRSSDYRRLLETCVLAFHTNSTLLTPRIQKSQIELAIISTYALQLSWIYTFFAPSTPVVLVTQPAPSENGSATIKQVLPNWIRVTPFLRGGRGVMHMKVRMIFLLEISAC